jgi:addiction module HigA family antidote
VPKKTFDADVARCGALTPEMAIRFSHATKTSPESWLNMQTKLDLRTASKNKPPNIVIFSRLNKIAM